MAAMETVTLDLRVWDKRVSMAVASSGLMVNQESLQAAIVSPEVRVLSSSKAMGADMVAASSTVTLQLRVPDKRATAGVMLSLGLMVQIMVDQITESLSPDPTAAARQRAMAMVNSDPRVIPSLRAMVTVNSSHTVTASSTAMEIVTLDPRVRHNPEHMVMTC